MSKVSIKTTAIISVLSLALSGCSLKNNQKILPHKVSDSELQQSKDDWHNAVERETTPTSQEPAPPAGFPKMLRALQPPDRVKSYENDKIINSSYDINTRYGLTYRKPLGWFAIYDLVKGWPGIVTYGSTGSYQLGYCKVYPQHPKYEGQHHSTSKGFLGFRGRNQISLKDALEQEFKIAQRIEGSFQYNLVGGIKEFNISGAKALRARIDFLNMNVDGPCSTKNDSWEIITTKSYYNTQVAVIVIERALDIKEPITDQMVEDIVKSIHKTDQKYIKTYQ